MQRVDHESGPVAVGLLGGCSSQVEPPPAPVSGAQTSVAVTSGTATDVDAPQDRSLPLTRYEFSMTEQARVGEALKLLLGDCMKQYGYRQDVALVRRQSADTLVWQVRDFGPVGNARRYGLTDPGLAARVGYRLRSQVERRPTPDDQDLAGFGPPTPQIDALLTGYAPATDATSAPLPVRTAPGGVPVPPGGCQAVAEQVLSPDGRVVPGQAPDLVASLRARSFEDAGTDPAVVRAGTAWRACMAAKGFPQVRSVLTAVTDLGLGLDTSSVSARERQAATADATCNLSSGFAVAYAAAEEQIQRAQVAEHEAELAELARTRDAVMIRTGEVLSRG